MMWDILNLDENEWEHLQILDRLHEEGISCYFVDIWLDDVVIVIGYHGDTYDISAALNIPTDIVYYDMEHAFVFINLYQLKVIRANLDKAVETFGKIHGFEVKE